MNHDFFSSSISKHILIKHLDVVKIFILGIGPLKILDRITKYTKREYRINNTPTNLWIYVNKLYILTIYCSNRYRRNFNIFLFNYTVKKHYSI